MGNSEGTFLIVIFTMIGMFVGFICWNGDSYHISPVGEMYNFIAVVDANNSADEVEVVVSEINDPDDHHFVTISKECYSTYKDGVRYRFLKTSSGEEKCEWIP